MTYFDKIDPINDIFIRSYVNKPDINSLQKNKGAQKVRNCLQRCAIAYNGCKRCAINTHHCAPFCAPFRTFTRTFLYLCAPFEKVRKIIKRCAKVRNVAIFFPKMSKNRKLQVWKKQFQKTKKSNFYHKKTKKKVIFKYLLAVKLYNLNSWKLIIIS